MHGLQLELIHRDNSFFNEVEKHYRFPNSCWKSALKSTLKSRKMDLKKHQTLKMGTRSNFILQ